MKSSIFFLFFLANLCFTNAQNWSLGAQWWYLQDEFMPVPGDSYTSIKKIGDTIIQNRACSVLSGALVLGGGNTLILCQDGDKILFYEPSDAVFYPLYDFSKRQIFRPQEVFG